LSGDEREAAQLLSLVEAVYDAAVDSQRWPAALVRCREFIGGMGATICSKGASAKRGQVYYGDGGMDPAYARSYFERYAPFDPANYAHLFAALEQPISAVDITDYDEFLDSRFFREWVEPQGIVDFISAPVEKSGDWAIMFGVFRHQRDGMADEATRYRMRRLIPHVRRAILIGNTTVQAKRLAATLDQLTAAVLLVDPQGHLVHANVAGERLIRKRGPLHVAGGRLEADSEIGEALSAASKGDFALGARGISVPLASEQGVGFTAHVLPLTSGARSEVGHEFGASAAVFVHPVKLDMQSAAGLIARTFALSPSELRVVLAIVEANSVAGAAEALGLGEATIKTHLYHVFSKTGTSNQADLVKLVASFAIPLRQHIKNH
jgi:DNA-binding CsgD family transcriptional regulator